MEATCARVDEAAAYVLGNLSPYQRERFDEHTRRCVACAHELELLTEAAAAPELMASRPAPPPADHEHLLDGASKGGSGRRTGDGDNRGAQMRPDPFRTADRLPKKRRRIMPIPKPALIGLMGVLVVAALTIYMSNRTVSTTYARGATAWPNTAGIALQLQGSHGELLLNHIPAAPAGERYEVWYLATHAKTLTKLRVTLKLNGKGQAGLKLPGDIHDYALIGVYAVSGLSTTRPSVSDHPVAIVYVPAAGKTATSAG